MSKESEIKKRLAQKAKQNEIAGKSQASVVKRSLTAEEKAAIVRDRLAKRPIVVLRYANGKLNTRFIFSLALLIVAMVVALFFLTRN